MNIEEAARKKVVDQGPPEALPLPDGRVPEKGALSERIDRTIEGAVQAATDKQSHLDLAQARFIFEGLQAHYELLRASGYGLVRFRIVYDLVKEALVASVAHGSGASSAAELERLIGDVASYQSREHRARVHARALAIAADLDAAPAPAPQPRAHRAREAEALSLGATFVELPTGNGDENVSLEKEFALEMLSAWDEPRLTTTAHAVEVLHMLSPARRAPASKRQPHDSTRAGRFIVDPDVLEFVDERYAGGRFTDHVDSAKVGRQPQDLYETSSGIAVFKAANDIACGDQPSASELPRLFDVGENAGPERARRYVEIREYAERRLRELVANPDAGTLVEINHAIRILSNTCGDLPGGITSVIEPIMGALEAFLLDCLCEAAPQGSRKLPAFAMGRGRGSVACLTACLAAWRIVKVARISNPKLKRHLAASKAFVLACRVPGSGFGSSIGHVPDLLHTYMGITLVAELECPPLGNAAYADVMGFVNRCYKRGGYSLLPDWKPSAYGTRLALQIFSKLGLLVPRKSEVITFIEGLLAVGHGYRGLPPDVPSRASLT